jgi:chorismate-pyruvate lyase
MSRQIIGVLAGRSPRWPQKGRRPEDAFVPQWALMCDRPTTVADLADADVIGRVIVTTDGTVTELLEAWAGESVALGELAQEEGRLHRGVRALDASEGDRILRRDVLLVGTTSRRALLYAESLIALDRLPAPIADGLLHSRTPIGRLLRQSRLETYREILQITREEADAAGSRFGRTTDELFIARTYRVISGGRPVMLIHEKLPAHIATRPA